MRVLLAEDDPMIGASVRRGLAQDGFAVDWVEDGRAAQVALAEHVHDALVLDLGLPRQAGLEVLTAMRRAGDTRPVLITTARDAIADRVAGLDAGADDYLVKPFDLDELAARLRALLRRGARAPVPERIQVGPLTLDTRAQKAACGAADLPLTTREYALLEFFARRAGVVVGRSEIAEHVWDESYDPLSNVIDVYVQRLRRKLALGGGERLIKTRRGAGYVLAND